MGSDEPRLGGLPAAVQSPEALAQHSRRAWGFWARLGSPRHVCAPMVRQSELAFRMLVRARGCQLCFSPMIPAERYLAADAAGRAGLFRTVEADRPLIVQLGGRDPQALLEAGRLLAPHCDGLDINLGCPQATARRDRIGAYLMDEPELAARIVGALASLQVPVSAKIRVFGELHDTVKYARMLQDAGASLLTVHGRTRSQRHSGRACWAQIAAVRAAVRIPVIANGNIRDLTDVEACLEHTGCAAVMSAYGLLKNPFLFDREREAESSFVMASEYLASCRDYPPATRLIICDHLLAVLGDELAEHRDVTQLLRCPSSHQHLSLEQFGMLVQLVSESTRPDGPRLTVRRIIKFGRKQRERERKQAKKQLEHGSELLKH